VIILNWNGWSDTIECLDSLYRINYALFDTVVVDNGSVDDSVNRIKQYCLGKKAEGCSSEQFAETREGSLIQVLEYTYHQTSAGVPEYTLSNLGGAHSKTKLYLLDCDKNYGFAEGNNIALRFALENLSSDYFLLLNNDTVVDSSFLLPLVQFAESHPDAGALGSKVLFYAEPTKIQSAGVLVKKNIFNYLGLKAIDVADFISRGFAEKDLGQYNEICSVPSLIGCCILLRKDVIKACGLLDASFFLYHEESDWMYRIRKQGYSLYYIPESKIWHKYSASSGGRFNPKVVYFCTRNSVFFAQKHNTKVSYALLILWYLVYVHMTKIVLYLLIERQPRLLLMFYRGLFDGILRISQQIKT